MQNERSYVLDTIDALLNGTGGEWDWDDFEHTSLQNRQLNSIRLRAIAVEMPFDSKGEAQLLALLEEARTVTDVDPEKPRPWRIATGAAVGLVIGGLIWWDNFIPAAGLSQNLHLLLTPTAIGIVIVTLRNRLKKVGAYDPDLIASNKQGRV